MPRDNLKRFHHGISSEDENTDLETGIRPPTQVYFGEGTSWKEPKESEIQLSSKDNPKDEIPVSSTIPGLVERILGGKFKISPHRLYQLVIIAYTALVSYVFVMDNSFGRIDKVEGLNWLLTKIVYLSIFFVIVLVILIFGNLLNDFISKFNKDEGDK
jgi:hypothetical protein